MGFRVKEIRENKGMSQEELANRSGVSRQTISAIENGKTSNVMSGTLIALAEALDTTIDVIFFNEAV